MNLLKELQRLYPSINEKAWNYTENILRLYGTSLELRARNKFYFLLQDEHEYQYKMLQFAIEEGYEDLADERQGIITILSHILLDLQNNSGHDIMTTSKFPLTSDVKEIDLTG